MFDANCEVVLTSEVSTVTADQSAKIVCSLIGCGRPATLSLLLDP